MGGRPHAEQQDRDAANSTQAASAHGTPNERLAARDLVVDDLRTSPGDAEAATFPDAADEVIGATISSDDRPRAASQPRGLFRLSPATRSTGSWVAAAWESSTGRSSSNSIACVRSR